MLSVVMRGTDQVEDGAMRLISGCAAAGFAGLLALGPAAAGETVSYNGSGAYTAQKLTMTLGNGDMVFTAWNEGMATISTDPPILLFGRCMGLGLIDISDAYIADVYCTFRANDEDSFDVKARSGTDGGRGEVIGGSGRWAGATGAIRMTRTSQQENSGTYTFEVELTTP